MPDYETTPEYWAWVEAKRTPTAEDKAEYRAKLSDIGAVKRAAMKHAYKHGKSDGTRRRRK